MRFSRIATLVLTSFILTTVQLCLAQTNVTNGVATTAVYVPDFSHANQPLPDGVVGWDSLNQSTEAEADQPQAKFTINFTNLTANNLVVLSVRPSCGCTTAQLPPLPWTVGPGTNGQIGITVNLEGKSGILMKNVNIGTDQGTKTIYFRINMHPPVVRTLSEADRAQGMAMAKADRQAVFKGDCVSCHAKNIEGKYGKPLYDSVCGICHEAENRASMVPNLHELKTPTNDEFWRIWIAHGKPGSLMPAFATSDGGPLTDMQIASIAAYLRSAIPSAATNSVGQ